MSYFHSEMNVRRMHSALYHCKVTGSRKKNADFCGLLLVTERQRLISCKTDGALESIGPVAFIGTEMQV